MAAPMAGSCRSAGRAALVLGSGAAEGDGVGCGGGWVRAPATQVWLPVPLPLVGPGGIKGPAVCLPNWFFVLRWQGSESAGLMTSRLPAGSTVIDSKSARLRLLVWPGKHRIPLVQ